MRTEEKYEQALRAAVVSLVLALVYLVSVGSPVAGHLVPGTGVLRMTGPVRIGIHLPMEHEWDCSWFASGGRRCGTCTNKPSTRPCSSCPPTFQVPPCTSTLSYEPTCTTAKVDSTSKWLTTTVSPRESR